MCAGQQQTQKSAERRKRHNCQDEAHPFPRRQRGFSGKVLVVTAGVEKEQAADLIRNGISGIFMKHDSAALLIEGGRDALAGKVWFDPALLQEAVGGAGVRQESKAERFTERERQV